MALLHVETLQLPAHMVHPLRQRAELVAIGHADGSAEAAGCHLVEEALCFAHRKDERPGDHETAEQREDYRAHRECAGQNQRPAVGGGDALAQPRHSILLRPDQPTHLRRNFGVESFLATQKRAGHRTKLAVAYRIGHVGHHRHRLVLR